MLRLGASSLLKITRNRSARQNYFPFPIVSYIGSLVSRYQPKRKNGFEYSHTGRGESGNLGGGKIAILCAKGTGTPLFYAHSRNYFCRLGTSQKASVSLI